jgi:hypothetical protein
MNRPTSARRYVASLLNCFFNRFQGSLLVCPYSHTIGLLYFLLIRVTYYILYMAATHHFHEHNRPLPVMQILNDGSLFSFGMSGYWYTTYEAHQCLTLLIE